MNDLICPHCHNSLSYGAQVCQGCGAEVHYGVPRTIKKYWLIAAFFVATVIYINMVHNHNLWGLTATYLATLIVGFLLLKRWYRGRVTFYRNYYT